MTKPHNHPAALGIRLMWQSLREEVIANFPQAPGLPDHPRGYLEGVEDAFLMDAYHSLSIEGYRVTEALIEQVRGGHWNPDSSAEDRERRDALAACGYWQAFQEVKKSVGAVLSGSDPGKVAEQDHKSLSTTSRLGCASLNAHELTLRGHGGRAAGQPVVQSAIGSGHAVVLQ